MTEESSADPARRQVILAELHRDRFADMAPAEVWAVLLDEGPVEFSSPSCPAPTSWSTCRLFDPEANGST